MKMCPHCKINIGGNLEKCPLCQNVLTGEGERDYVPKIEIKTRLRRKAFKIVMFVFFALIILNLALDFLFLETDHHSWSPLIVAWLLVIGWIIEFIIRKHYNLLKAMFFTMIALVILSFFSEAFITLAWDLPYLVVTAGYVVPILCSGNLVANFILSFIDKHFTDYSLIYMFLNILVGVAPWIALLIFYRDKPPLTWSICMVVNVLAFFGLIVFKGRTVLGEFKKRFHL